MLQGKGSYQAVQVKMKWLDVWWFSSWTLQSHMIIYHIWLDKDKSEKLGEVKGEVPFERWGWIPSLINRITLRLLYKHWKGQVSRAAKRILMAPTLHQQERVSMCVFESRLSDGNRQQINSRMWRTVHGLSNVNFWYFQMCCHAV